MGEYWIIIAFIIIVISVAVIIIFISVTIITGKAILAQ